MSNTHPNPDLFPVAYGNEEETGMLDNSRYADSWDEPYELVTHRRFLFPPELRSCDDFLSNGFKIYDGGSPDEGPDTNLERATPECANVGELRRYIRASEMLLTEIAGAFAVASSVDLHRPVTVRIQRRVVDSRGSRKGCHDNFGYEPEAPILRDFDGLPPSVLKHLAYRSIRDGAGYVRAGKLHYAQKIGGLTAVDKYGFVGSMYRITVNEGTPRIEVRCSDINISDWAVKMRVGCTAMVLALNNTPLASAINEAPLRGTRLISEAKQANALALNEDGSLRSGNASIWRAVDFEQQCAELVMDKLQLYTDDLPPEFYDIARESYRYNEDFKKVLRGEETIHLLADRADWAAKFSSIIRRIREDRSFGIVRSLYDMTSRAQDLRYDNITITAEDGVLQPTQWGYGYKLRDRHFLQDTVDHDEAVAATKKAPETTRAALRASLLLEQSISKCDWHKLRVSEGDATYWVHLPRVNQTELDIFDIGILDPAYK